MKKILFVGLFAATQAHAAAVVVVSRPVVVAPRPVVVTPRPATAPTPPPPKASSTAQRTTTTTSTPFIWPAWVPFVGSRCHDDKECKK